MLEPEVIRNKTQQDKRRENVCTVDEVVQWTTCRVGSVINNNNNNVIWSIINPWTSKLDFVQQKVNVWLWQISAENYVLLLFLFCSQASREFPAQGRELCCDWKPRVPEGGEMYRPQSGGKRDERRSQTSHNDTRDYPLHWQTATRNSQTSGTGSLHHTCFKSCLHLRYWILFNLLLKSSLFTRQLMLVN